VPGFMMQTPDIGKAGLYRDACRLAKTALESADWSAAADKQAVCDMLEGWLPKAISPWSLTAWCRTYKPFTFARATP